MSLITKDLLTQFWAQIVARLDTKSDTDHTHSWDTLEPFSNKDNGSLDTLTWDGNTAGLTSVEIDGMPVYKISSSFPNIVEAQ